MAHKDGKRPEGCTLIPWRGGKPLGWDVTVCTTVADSYLTAASHTAGAVAEQAADRKCRKYAELSAAYEFQPVAVETHGPLSASTVSFLLDLGRKISERTVANLLKYSFYFSGSVSWFSGSIRSSFTNLSQLRTTPTRSHSSLFLDFVFNPRDLYYRG